MQTKSFGKNLLLVLFSRIVSLLSSIAIGFVLPKMLSVTDYGFYKVFTLYSVYTALLHFGFVDGILLKLSGKEYELLDKLKMRAYTQFFIIFQAIVSLVMLVVGIIFASEDYLFIIFALALNMFFVNITTYYQFVSQAVQRFGDYSVKNLVVSVIKILFVSVLFVLDILNMADVSYRIYLFGLNALDFLMMLWYIVIYSDITFGRRESIRILKKDISLVFKAGIVLTLAYQVSHLILALDRQFVNLLFPTETFAVYSFAYNIVSMVSTLISSASIVLLPMLKSQTNDIVIKSYKISLSTVSIVASSGLLLYFPLALFIRWFLPNYIGSVEYISVVLPAFLFSSVVTVVMFTIDKVLDNNFDFFKDGCIVFFLGLLSNIVAYILFKSPKAISYASLLVMMVWFLISGMRLYNRTKVRISKEFIYLLVISVGFLIIVNLVNNVFIELLLYSIWLALWMILFYKDIIKKIAITLKNKIVYH